MIKIFHYMIYSCKNAHMSDLWYLGKTSVRFIGLGAESARCSEGEGEPEGLDVLAAVFV